MTSIHNRYCQRLGISVPRIEDAAGRPEVTLFQLVVMALLERGGPMTVVEIAARLDRATLPARLVRPDFVVAVKKAWHGQPPLVRDGDQRLALDLLSSELSHIAFVTGLRPPVQPPPGPAELRLPEDDEPLSQVEVTAAFSGRSLDMYSSIRKAAAVLEAWGTPQTLDEINERLRTLTDYGGRIDTTTVRAWRTDLVVDSDGSLRLNPASSQIGAFRRDIRRMAATWLRASAERRDFKLGLVERERQRAEDERNLMAQASRTRRALLHLVPPGQEARGAAVIDLSRRASEKRDHAPNGSAEPADNATNDWASSDVQLFMANNLLKLADRLEEFDFLAGVDLRVSLRTIGLDPERWLLAELRPVQRTFRPAERSAVPVTLPAVVQATTGTSRVPADVATWGRLLDPKRLHDVAGRLATEARALCLLYEYGALHGGVRVRTRPGDRLLPVEWGLAGDPDVRSVLEAAMRACAS